MKKLLLFLVVLSISVASAATINCDVSPNAPPVFVPGSPTPTVVTCDVYGTEVIFDQFEVVPATPGAPAQFSLNQALFDNVANTIYLQFNPSLTNGLDSYLYFRVSTENGAALLSGVDMTVSGTNAAITELVCADPISRLNNVCSGSPLANYAVSSGNSANVQFDSPQSTIYIYKNVLTRMPPPESELSSFTQSFHVVPEPTTFALLGGGLMAFALYRRRRA